MGKEVKIEICGSGCEKFFQTVHSFEKAVQKNGINSVVEEITDGRKIAAKGRLNSAMPFISHQYIHYFTCKLYNRFCMAELSLSIYKFS